MRKKLYRLYKVLYSHYGQQKWWPAKTKFEVIAGAILTQNTSWKNVEKAVKKLAKADLLNPRSMHKARKTKIAPLIKSAGYYNVKAERLKNFTDFLFAKYGGSLKKMFRVETNELRRNLLDVNGLGPETVDSILLYAGGKPIFVIDAYTKRILSRHNFISEAEEYDDVQRLFMDNLRPESRLFNEYHALLVRLAKDSCNKNPKCSTCPARIMLDKCI